MNALPTASIDADTATATDTVEAPAALTVEGLRIAYGAQAPAVDGIDVRVGRGEIVGLVGESGCGKSSVATALLGLLPPSAAVTAARLDVGGTGIIGLSERRLNAVRGSKVSMIFQEPMTALNPCMRIGAQIAEVLQVHGIGDKRSRAARAVELLELVQVPDPVQRARQYPHELSGGMRQRVVIAIAMAAEPDLLVADEPTTALDVTVQAQVLDLVMRLRDETGLSVLLISHDLAVVADVCDRVLVMYAGEVVEEGPPHQVLSDPQHPYTRALVRSIPGLAGPVRMVLPTIMGQITDADRATAGCRFRARCELAGPGCERPQRMGPTSTGIAARCWRVTPAAQRWDAGEPTDGH